MIDHRLDSIELHDSLHGCRNKRGTGTAIIEAKLAQQLSYLELKPFYGVFQIFGRHLMRWIGSGLSCCWKDTGRDLG